jgi:hypothetical protein
MSRRPARCTEADIKRALKAALSANPPMAVEILPNGTIRIVPFEGALHRPSDCANEEAGNSWDDFITKPDSSKYEQTRLPAKNDQVRKWYDQIGYDPNTMDIADFMRLIDADAAKWRASIPGTPLQMREKDVLRQFKHFRVGDLIDSKAIKGCGPGTAERLETRGYIEVRQTIDRLIGYVLTNEGLDAARGIDT